MHKNLRPSLSLLTTALLLTSLLLTGCSWGTRANGNPSTDKQPASQPSAPTLKIEQPTIQPSWTPPATTLKPSATAQPKPSATSPAGAIQQNTSDAQDDQELNSIDQSLDQIINDLNTTDTVDDFK